jgi:hypothetical protein
MKKSNDLSHLSMCDSHDHKRMTLHLTLVTIAIVVDY